MSLKDITESKAVQQAIDEYDEIGRDAFLEKYGFGYSKSYWLIHNGRTYDSKAIIGAAHGYQHPDEGPLKANSFSGGLSTVARKLRSLGFHMQIGGKDTSRRYWALCANTKIYDIESAIKHLEVDYWSLDNKDITPGDQAIIWKTKGNDQDRGIIALAEITGPAEMKDDANNPFWTNPEGKDSKEWRFPVRYHRSKKLPLWSESEPFLETLSVYKSKGGRLFKLTDEQWNRISELTGGITTDQDGDDDIDVIISPTKRRGGQGRGLSGPERKAVELRAMDEARKHYEAKGWVVKDVSGNSSYDYLCTKGKAFLHVEVKGTTTAGKSVLLTRNEVRHAKETYPDVALFVVSLIQLRGNEKDGYLADGGEVAIYEPWDISQNELKPVGYECIIEDQ
jgi:hypothetical protein